MRTRLKDWLDRPTIRAALLLIAIAAVLMAGWRLDDGDRFDAWMPNIVTGLLAVAATITFVEWIVQRERRESGAGRRTAAYVRLENALLYLTIALNYDLEGRPEPGDPVDVIADWFRREGQLQRNHPGDGTQPAVLSGALYFALGMSRVLAADRDVLSNELLETMTEIEEQVVLTQQWVDTSARPHTLAMYLMAAEAILKAVSAFTIVLRRERGGEWMAVLDRVVQIELAPEGGEAE